MLDLFGDSCSLTLRHECDGSLTEDRIQSQIPASRLILMAKCSFKPFIFSSKFRGRGCVWSRMFGVKGTDVQHRRRGQMFGVK